MDGGAGLGLRLFTQEHYYNRITYKTIKNTIKIV